LANPADARLTIGILAGIIKFASTSR